MCFHLLLLLRTFLVFQIISFISSVSFLQLFAPVCICWIPFIPSFPLNVYKQLNHIAEAFHHRFSRKFYFTSSYTLYQHLALHLNSFSCSSLPLTSPCCIPRIISLSTLNPLSPRGFPTFPFPTVFSFSSPFCVSLAFIAFR